MNFSHKNGPLDTTQAIPFGKKSVATSKRPQNRLLKVLPFMFKHNKKKSLESSSSSQAPELIVRKGLEADSGSFTPIEMWQSSESHIIENVPSPLDSDVSSRSRPAEDESSSLASSESSPQLDTRGGSDALTSSLNQDDTVPAPCFHALRFSYLAVLLVIYLADGLQGTHLYKLYDEYGYSVASLYSLGFFTGGVLSPITGPWVDKMGRKRAAILYCVLEILINSMEQYPYLSFLIASRMIGGFTTNLLRCVFETWLDSEFRKREAQQLDDFRKSFTGGNFAKQQKSLKSQQHHAYEILMRDSVIISNAAAIGSGYLSHVLSEMSGPVGPFRGAVACTVAALVVVTSMWTENYGGTKKVAIEGENMEGSEEESSQSILEFLQEAGRAFMADRNMLKVGVVQGLSVGSLQIFVYLWSPVLMDLAKAVPADAVASTWGLDRRGEPAFGLIFMVFMSSCVLGGLVAPTLRKAATALLTPIVHDESAVVRPMAVEFLTASCYFLAACMLLVPCLSSGPDGFTQSLWAFVLYEVLVGIVSPCEGVIRNLYFPSHARASVTTLPSMVVNGAVTLAVFGTQFVSLVQVCSAVVGLMVIAAYLQLSLISDTEWSTITTKVQDAPRKARSMSLTVIREAPKLARSLSSSFYENAVSQPKEALRRWSSTNFDSPKDKID